jgi:hypothetical protein
MRSAPRCKKAGNYPLLQFISQAMPNLQQAKRSVHEKKGQVFIPTADKINKRKRRMRATPFRSSSLRKGGRFGRPFLLTQRPVILIVKKAQRRPVIRL